ncbi:hypothetical protein DFH11DRAFT_1692087 [Phellopilus nigrolimitatus]|nr:hypothetical protein DFH11DRAFT_1692087 [Phellopilus nigrolimitatus]
MPSARHTHTVDPVYAPPVLRAPSPTETISTEYGQDETSIADMTLSDEDFARRVEEEIGLRRTKWSDAGPIKPIILPRSKDPREEQMIFERVMANLRAEVKKLEEEELFESVTLKKNSPTFHQQPVSRDLDAIMRGMMISPPNAAPNTPAFNGAIPRPNGDSSGATAIGNRYGNSSRRL